MVKKQATINPYREIYNRLIGGQSQKKISMVLQKDKGQISRMVNRLIEGGYIICFNPQSRDKIYIATKKPFKADEVYKLPSSKSQRIHGRCNIIQIQKSSFITRVLSPPKKVVKWDKEWESNGVNHQLFSYPFSNVGEVKFQRIIGRNSDQVKIILPRLVWDKKDSNPEKFLRETADRAGSWFMHRFKMELVGLRVCQRPDYAMMLTDPKLIDMAQHGTYESNGVMIDSSAPDDLPEIESKSYDDIFLLSNVPDEIRNLKQEMAEVKGVVFEIRDMFMGGPVRPDERRDVA